MIRVSKGLALALAVALPAAADGGHYQATGPLAAKAEAWIKAKGQPLEPYSQDFVRKLAEVAGRMKLPMPIVSGFRSTQGEARAILGNYQSVYKKEGEAAAEKWLNKLYKYRKDKGEYARNMLAFFVGIQKKEKTFEEWHTYFANYVKTSGIASHTNGRSFDIAPHSPEIKEAIETTIKEGTKEKLFRKHDFVDEKDKSASVHYHVGLSPP
jgi:hypothetical protein